MSKTTTSSKRTDASSLIKSCDAFYQAMDDHIIDYLRKRADAAEARLIKAQLLACWGGALVCASIAYAVSILK